jgi:hypothetical protein
MDDEGEDNDDLDGGQDMADEIHAEADSGSEIDEEMDYGGGANIHAELARQMDAENAQNAIIQSGISKEKW